ncbi:MAG: molybdopterin adenylyltransferase [Euryarchaeota archaeon]|nr:molybdopterin adenylyltransferase [Euryarchaeota archaeon]MED5487436.1 molybdopterin adenylyltransferase [Candidatus Thermoplasmatota archaeon]
MDTVHFGVLTASDRASNGEYEDLSGPSIEEFLHLAIKNPFQINRKIVPDEQTTIESEIIELCNLGCSVIITTGGTGPAPRDVTPDATENVCERLLPGFGEQMRAISLRHVPTAVLSRQTAGIRGKSLILNLPGSPRSIRETIDEIWPAIPYCIDLIGGPYIETTEGVWSAWRPPHARRLIDE